MATDQSTSQDAPGTHQGQAPATDQVEQGTGTYELVSVKQAAARLGCSVQTVRRLIRVGKLRADLVARPQGSAWRVMLPVSEDAPSDHVVQTGTSLERARHRDVPDIASALAPLVEELAATRQLIAQQGETIGEQRERLAALAAELEQVKATLAELQAPKPPDPPMGHAILPPVVKLPPLPGEDHSWWQRLGLSLLVILLATVAVFFIAGRSL